MRLRLDEVAIFVLGTTSHIHKRSLYDSRLTPIVDTYGQFFDNLYFVFGTNLFDYKFLRTNCKPRQQHDAAAVAAATTTAASGRRLKAHTRQTPIEHKNSLYICPVATTNITNAAALGIQRRSTINILWIGNCTGEYFGIGPTCRCQETMRFYLGSAEPRLAETRWFVFMDDDLYIRPYSLLSLLDQFPTTHSRAGAVDRNDTVALISDSDNFGFAFSTRWKPETHNCMSDPQVHAFSYAQPAILSRDTVRFMQSALHANGLTELQALWGGTHDALLGLLLFAFDVNVFSFKHSYDTQYFYKENTRRFNQDLVFVIHRLRSFKLHGLTELGPREMAQVFGDVVYNVSLVQQQLRVGASAYRRLVRKKPGAVMRTVFRDRARRLFIEYKNFNLSDCAMG